MQFKATEAAQIASGTTVSMHVLVNGMADTAKALTGKYVRDNELSAEEWRGTLNHTAEGMFRGFGMALVNAPSNMAVRVYR